MKRGKKLKSLSWHKKKLWKVFSQFIRVRDGGKCFTCDRENLSGSEYHTGHFIKASVCGIELYFNEKNNNGQCYYCNIHLDGNQYEYGIRLGKKVVDELYEIRATTKGTIWTRQQYQEKIDYYTTQLQNVEPR